MVRLAAFDPEVLDQAAGEVAAAMRQAVEAAAAAGAQALAEGGPPTPADLATVAGRFQLELDDRLEPLLAQCWHAGVGHTAFWLALEDLEQVVDDQGPAGYTAAAAVPGVVDDLAAQHLAGARNRLAGVSDALWAATRAALLEGLAQREGTEQLAARVRQAAEVPMARAQAIARTEAQAALHAGGLAAVRSLRVAGTKTWHCALDARVRPSHAPGTGAHGQTVPIGERFIVGGWPLDHPGDPAGPPEETVNCRCGVDYDLDLGATTAAAGAFDFHPDQPRDPVGKWVDVPGVGGGPGVAEEVGDWLAATAEREEIQAWAAAKIADAPVPSEAAVRKAQAELAAAKARGTRPGGESRGGNAADRRRQRRNLFRQAGGEERGHVPCHGCGVKTHWADPGSPDNPKGYARFERGKIFVKCQGGGYQLPNLLPECFGCNRHRSDTPLREENEC